jgi:hypothetical protein
MGRRDRARPDHVGALTRIAPLVGATQVANTSAPPAVSTLRLRSATLSEFQRRWCRLYRDNSGCHGSSQERARQDK